MATPEIETAIDGRLGVITLNRPQAINALTSGMVAAISAQLADWSGDTRVRAILFEGRGAKGFCAGGDVRAVRADIVGGETGRALQFFADEYRMNGEIAGHGKPVVALADGIVMGGGIGIAGHADFRFATTNARFAMPEGAIGFVPDIGVNAILARAPLHRAMLFLLTGLTVGPADALALGLVDCIIKPDRLAEVRRAIVAAAASDDVETALVGLMQSETIEAGDAALCGDADLLDEELMLGSAQDIIAAITETAAAEPQLERIAETIAARSPASLEAIVQSHLAARRLGDITPILRLDLALARLISQYPDFAEGVRALLVDKDNAPKWQPRSADFAAQLAREIAIVEQGWAAERGRPTVRA